MTDIAPVAPDAPALFLCPVAAPHIITVNGQSHEMHFRAISVGMLFKVRNLASPLAKFIGAILEDRKGDNGFVQRNLKNEHGTDDIEVMTRPIEPALAAERYRQRSEALESLVAAATDTNNIGILAEIVIDSATDSLPDDCRNVQGFQKKVSAPAFAQMLVGVAKANKDVFGPLSDRMASTARLVEDAIRAKVGEAKTTTNEG